MLQFMRRSKTTTRLFAHFMYLINNRIHSSPSLPVSLASKLRRSVNSRGVFRSFGKFEAMASRVVSSLQSVEKSDEISYVSQQEAAEIDEILMGPLGFSVDQLMVCSFLRAVLRVAALPGLQAKGVALTKVPKIKFLIIISGAKMRNVALADKAFASPIEIPENDFLKPHGTVLLELYVDPVVIHHPKGHTIPRLDEKGLEMMLSFIEMIQKEVTSRK